MRPTRRVPGQSRVAARDNRRRDATILDEVAWQIDLPQLKRQLGIKEGESYAAEGMAARAEAIGRPKAMYKASLIESRGEDHVVM